MNKDIRDSDPFVAEHLPEEPPRGRNIIGMFYLRYMLEHMDKYSNTALKHAHGNSVPVDETGEIAQPSEATRMIGITPPMERGGVPIWKDMPIEDEIPDLPNEGDFCVVRHEGVITTASRMGGQIVAFLGNDRVKVLDDGK